MPRTIEQATRGAAREQAKPAVARPGARGLPGVRDHVGNQAVAGLAAWAQARTVARLGMPLGGSVPAGTTATDFATFLKAIQDEEAKLPPAEQTNTKLMVTRLRKLFYGGEGWDKYLIPGAAGVKPLYGFDEKETKREAIGDTGVAKVTKEGELKGAPAALAKPGTFQEVKMPNGDFVDVGHVLAGLDAFDNPSAAAGPLNTYKVDSNVAAVTWMGDLASIAGEIILTTIKANKKTYTEAELQAQVDALAPGQDMLGNVDAYAVHSAFTTDVAAGKKVSQILAEYYGGAGVASAAGEAARKRRFTTFATTVGLGALSGGAFVNEAMWKKQNLPQLRTTTSLYVGSTTAPPGPSGDPLIDAATYVAGQASRTGLMDGTGENAVNVRLLDVFVEELRKRVAQEFSAANPLF